jgi:hypothetical protein
MAMNLVDNGYLQEVYRNYSGGMPTEARSLTEMLRQELWARGTASRRALCVRIIDLVRPLANVSMDTLRGILDEMEHTGDLTTGPGGAVAAAPLRIVACGGERYRLFGTLPNRNILDYVTHINPMGTARELITDSVEAMDALLEKFCGIRLSAERWAGFDRVLPAGADWLKQLDFRLDNEAENPGAFDSQVMDTWMVYRPASSKGKSQSPWKKPLANDDGRLWRGWSPYGWPISLWTSGGSPSKLQTLRLTSDEAIRTAFSLAIEAGKPLVIKVDVTGPAAMLNLETFLPSAEYRYLMTLGELLDSSGSKRVLRIPRDAWPGVEETLRKQLGVIIENAGI